MKHEHPFSSSTVTPFHIRTHQVTLGLEGRNRSNEHVLKMESFSINLDFSQLFESVVSTGPLNVTEVIRLPLALQSATRD